MKHRSNDMVMVKFRERIKRGRKAKSGKSKRNMLLCVKCHLPWNADKDQQAFGYICRICEKRKRKRAAMNIERIIEKLRDMGR